MKVPAPKDKTLHDKFGYFANGTRIDESREWALNMGIK